MSVIPTMEVEMAFFDTPPSQAIVQQVDQNKYAVTFADRWRCSSAVGWRGEVR